MRGNVQVNATGVGGWVFDPDSRGQAIEIRLMLDGAVVKKGVAALPRPDVAETLGIEGAMGFRLPSPALSPQDLARAQVQALGAADRPLAAAAQAEPAAKRRGQYQSFDDAKGASQSAEKLKALRLASLQNRHSEATPLEGLSLLDLGCNEGFFCGEAVRQGARRVVGLDSNNGFLERARKRFPTAEYRHGSWWDIPDETFDVILFLSAIHYEPEQRALLQKLAGHLTPTGRAGPRMRHRRRPAQVLGGGQARRRGPALSDDADAHRGAAEALCGARRWAPACCRAATRCRARCSTATCGEHGAALRRPSTTGKSTLTRDLARRDVPLICTDQLLGQILRDKRYDWSPAAGVVRRFPAQPPVNYARIGRAVAEECPRDFVEILMLEAPLRGRSLLHRRRDPDPRAGDERAPAAPARAQHPAVAGRAAPGRERIAAGRSGALAIPPGRL